MFLLTTGELIADIVAMAGIYCLGRIVTDFRYLYIAEIKKDHLELMHKKIIFPFY